MEKRKYLSRDIDANGNERWYLRRPCQPKVRLPHGPSHPSFNKTYARALRGAIAPHRPRTPKRANIRSGYIYFIRHGEAVKIGYSVRPFHRFSALETGIPGPLMCAAVAHGSRDDERALHARFASCRLSGEWFKAVPSIRALMARAAAYGTIECPG